MLLGDGRPLQSLCMAPIAWAPGGLMSFVRLKLALCGRGLWAPAVHLIKRVCGSHPWGGRDDKGRFSAGHWLNKKKKGKKNTQASSFYPEIKHGVTSENMAIMHVSVWHPEMIPLSTAASPNVPERLYWCQGFSVYDAQQTRGEQQWFSQTTTWATLFVLGMGMIKCWTVSVCSSVFFLCGFMRDWPINTVLLM